MTKMVRSASEITAELMAKLRVKYAPPSFALIEGVADGTGLKQSRWCDALAFGLWPSKGLSVEGFEVKATRSDWQREMQDPDKARAFSVFCDRWYILAPRGVVKLEELPSEWGLMEPSGRGLKIRSVATTIERIPPDRYFLAAIARYAVRSNAMESILATERAKIREEERAGLKKRLEYAKRYDDERVRELENRIDAFEKASGVNIDQWNAGDIGAAVKAVRGKGYDSIVRQLEDVVRWAGAMRDSAQKGLEALRPKDGDPDA